METTLIIEFVILTIILYFWAIIDVTRSRFKKPNMNTIWLLAVLFFPVLGSILYFQFKRKFVLKKSRKFQPNFNRPDLKTTE